MLLKVVVGAAASDANPYITASYEDSSEVVEEVDSFWAEESVKAAVRCRHLWGTAYAVAPVVTGGREQRCSPSEGKGVCQFSRSGTDLSLGDSGQRPSTNTDLRRWLPQQARAVNRTYRQPPHRRPGRELGSPFPVMVPKSRSSLVAIRPSLISPLPTAAHPFVAACLPSSVVNLSHKPGSPPPPS
ncbi:hypothetical protein TIFTF001_007754 [Ficus carica]|uniref:Uncharacterized protein n=1 Tax=Ficus carica TaxID=3494 RepID=A0AA87ZQW3_FICCA|nr:hypothetical protein TIFTF001_007754 [Ficus carica]